MQGKSFWGAGGPRQFIHQMFPVAATRSELIAAVLKRSIPNDDSKSYCDFYPLPACLPGNLVGELDQFIVFLSCPCQMGLVLDWGIVHGPNTPPRTGRSTTVLPDPNHLVFSRKQCVPERATTTWCMHKTGVAVLCWWLCHQRWASDDQAEGHASRWSLKQLWWCLLPSFGLYKRV